jgi:hypothetical protein
VKTGFAGLLELVAIVAGGVRVDFTSSVRM